MRIRDISVELAMGTPEWPGDTPYTCGWTASIADGSSVNLSSLTTSPHVGTHADAPIHVQDGWPGAHELPLDAFYGPAVVIDVTSASGELSFADIEPAISQHRLERLLLKTGSGIAGGVFPESWPALSEQCARTLLGLGLRLLGVDAPSVDSRESKNLAVHKMLFAGGAFLVENLDLRRIQPGAYELIALPLKVMALDAAPLRAVLIER
jgi:arylformamidase